MASKKCTECGGTMTRQTYRHTIAVGEAKVTDGSSQADVCVSCGNADLTLVQVQGYERRAAALVLRSVERASGAMFKFARKSLGLKQVDLAPLLGCDSATLSRWETGALPIERNNQLAMVAILDTVIQCHVEPSELFGFMHKTGGQILELEVDCPSKAA